MPRASSLITMRNVMAVSSAPSLTALVALLALGCGGAASSALFSEDAGTSDAGRGGGGLRLGRDAGEEHDGIDGGAPETGPVRDARAEGGRDASERDGGGPTDWLPSWAAKGGLPPWPGGACGPGQDDPTSACPAECTGGCLGGWCHIACTGTTCDDKTIQCPSNFKCEVECGASSCDKARVVCPQLSDCEVNCGGGGACPDIKVACPAKAPCGLLCGGGGSCLRSQIICGAAACMMQCGGGASGSDYKQDHCDVSCGCTSNCL